MYNILQIDITVQCSTCTFIVQCNVHTLYFKIVPQCWLQLLLRTIFLTESSWGGGALLLCTYVKRDPTKIILQLFKYLEGPFPSIFIFFNFGNVVLGVILYKLLTFFF